MQCFVLQGEDGTLVQWERQTLASLGLREADLEAALRAHPGPLVLSAVELPYRECRAYDQRQLRSGSGHTDIPDLILITDQGDVVVVEVKRLSNPELRGRDVVSQVVSYAASLTATPEARLVHTLTRGRCQSWEELCRADFTGLIQPDAVAKRLRQRVSRAELHLVIACDEAPTTLAEWVRAAGRQSALGFDLHVVEVRPLTPVGARRPVAWAPVRPITTTIIHRTVVRVETVGEAPVAITVTSDPPEVIEEGLAPRRVNVAAQALAAIGPAARRLGLTPEALWAELDAHHRRALALDWSDVAAAIGDDDDSGPHLRGKRGDGFVEGRFGLNLLSRWRPSVFLGAYLLPFDHKERPLAEGEGGDFALILDVDRALQRHSAHPALERLRARLRQDRGGWDFADSLGQPGGNPWHPLHLRRPLHAIFEGADTPEARFERWLEAARSALTLLLAGGELTALRESLRQD